MTRVAVLDDYLNRASDLAAWDALGPGVDVKFFREPMRGERLVDELAGFEVLVLMRERTAFPRAILEQLPALQLLVTTGMGNLSVDMEYLRERGVVVAGTRVAAPTGQGVGGPVEIAWALIFATAKRLLIEDRAIRAGRWQLDFPTNLAGKTLGLAGLGRLGAAMVPPARVFAMNVIAWSQNLTEEHAAEVGVTRVTKEELLRDSDFLSIHLVLSDRSRGLFGAAELEMMQPTAVVINTSRGPIVDEIALIEALLANRIAAAGLDVYDVEPPPGDHPFVSLENTVLAPHLGYVNEDGFRVMYNEVVEDVAAFLRGDPIRVLL
jgi:phosphoglycerate dehydrogenase-like enzyme